MDAGQYRMVAHALAQATTKIEHALIELADTPSDLTHALRKIQRAIDDGYLALDRLSNV